VAADEKHQSVLMTASDELLSVMYSVHRSYQRSDPEAVLIAVMYSVHRSYQRSDPEAVLIAVMYSVHRSYQRSDPEAVLRTAAETVD